MSADEIIKEPFKTVYDVTDQTPIEDIPPQYHKDTKQRWRDEYEAVERLGQAVEQFSINPDIEELLMEQAHMTISRHDDHIIRVIFHAGISAYSKHPLNVMLKCESGSGKTYSTLETLKLLPEEDVQIVGSQSPKVWSHETGIRKTRDGRVLDAEAEPKKPKRSDYRDLVYGEGDADRKQYAEDLKLYQAQKLQWDADCKDSFYEVDLRNKVVVFLESINLETFNMIKTTLSHDHEYIDHKYVDDKGRVHVTRLVGAPAMIFNTVDKAYNDEQATRNLTASPNTRIEKIEDSMRIACRKSAYPWVYDAESFNRRVIQAYIRQVKRFIVAGKLGVVLPFDETIIEGFSKEVVRDMRDFSKYLALLPSYVLFKLFQRPIVMVGGRRYLVPTVQDALDASSAFNSIIETTKTSTDYRVIEFYWKTVVNTSGLTAEALTDLYLKGKKHKTSATTVRKWLQRLEDLEYVDIREDVHENAKGYIDRRFNAYYPLKKDTPLALLSRQSVDLRAILEKGFEQWLENVPLQTDVPVMILKIDGTATPISVDKMRYLIIKNSLIGYGSESVFSVSKPAVKAETDSGRVSLFEKSVEGTFSRYVAYERIPRAPGVCCTAIGRGGYECGFEAEYRLNGGLYCVECFKEQAVYLQANGVGLKLGGDWSGDTHV
ncbi:MAG: hypothetical protein LBH74_03705 [Nitrososphaerota archaeon]|nr:hypothetical protein [Nitrososphaerota archaeon]